MKILGILLALVLVTSIFGFSGFALAEDEPIEAAEPVEIEAEEIGDPGITPDSALWGLDRALERISLALTFNRAAKAKKGLAHAQERLLEVKVMIQERKMEAAEEAITEHGKAFGKAKKEIEEIEDGESEEGTKETLKEIMIVQDELEEHEDQMELVDEIVTQEIIPELPEDEAEEAKKIIARAIVNTEAVETQVITKKDNAKLMLKAITEKPEAEIEEEIEEIEEESGLNTGRKNRARKTIERARKKIKEIKEEENINLDEIEYQLDEVEESLEEDFEDVENVTEEVKEYGNNISRLARQLRIAKQEGNFTEAHQALVTAARSQHFAVLERVKENLPEHVREKFEEKIQAMRQKLEEKNLPAPGGKGKGQDGEEGNETEEEEDEPECTVDADCEEGQVCVEGECEESEDEGNQSE